MRFADFCRNDKIKLNNMNDQYRTNDMYLAAFLLTRGFKIVENDRSMQNEVVFIFHETHEEARPAVEDYEHRKTTVEPRTFVGAIKSIKKIIQNR